MEEEKEDSFIDKIKANKKKIAIGALALSTVAIGAYMYSSKSNSIKEVSENTIKEYSNSDNVIDIAPHLRNLAKGQKASEEKIREAIEKGTPLPPGKTSVVGYKKVV